MVFQHCQGAHTTRSLRSFRTRKPNAFAAVTGFARPWALWTDWGGPTCWLLWNDDQHWSTIEFLVVPEKIWLKSWYQLEKMIQNEIIAHKMRLTNKLGNCLTELCPSKIGPALDKFTWCCFYLLFVCVEISWNTLKYSKQQNDRIGVPQEFSKMSSHFEIAILRLNLFNFRSLCIFSLHSNDLQCFMRFLVLSLKFPYEFMVPSVPSVSAVICALFPPPVSGIRGTFGKRLSDDGEAAAVPGFGQRSTEDFGSKPTFQRWTLHQFADPWGGEWRGFQDVPRNSENLGLSSKSGFQNFVLNSSGRCRAINIWRTTGSEKSPRTLVCVLSPMACDLTYTVSLFVWIACTNMLVRKKRTGKTLQC